jgi:deferrochelatase/peroxidase EfeB
VPADGAPAWLRGGTYLVARKIEMLVEAWDRVRLAEQETIFGRSKGPGAPLSGGDEFTRPDFAAMADGAPVIDAAAHVRLANPANLGGTRILRRGFNYVDGNTAVGRLDAGLFFLSFQRSPSQFISVQRALGTDRLNEYIRHVGSAIFAVPPGARTGGFVGETLFG